MRFDSEFSKQLIEIFKIELEEKLQIITDSLLALEKAGLSEEKTSKIIEDVFRAAHNIKGSARSIGVNNVAEISHHLETLFSSVQKKSITIDSNTTSFCLQAVDHIRAAMQCFIEEKPFPIDLRELFSRLSKESVSGKKRINKNPDKVSQKTHLQEEKLENQPKLPSVSTDSKTVDNEYETIRISLTHLDRISAMMETLQINKMAIDDHFYELTKLDIRTRQFVKHFKQTSYVLQNGSHKQSDEFMQKLAHTNMDSLMEIGDVIHKLYKSMYTRMRGLSTLCNSMQKELRMLRLIPVMNFLCTLPRMGRDLAHELNKQVNIEIKPNNVHVDKMVLEALKDPLIHLLRNAIDHGIENCDLRKKMGKPEIGKITIDVKEENNQILFSITDDGAGIDSQKIATIAQHKHLISHEELVNLNQQEILELIFHPGFTTKENISDISGRGIGLDVVKTNTNRLKGEVYVVTKIGKWTTFYLRAPLTLSSDRGLVIKSGGQLLAIPTSSVNRVLTKESQAVIDVVANQAIQLDTHTIPLHVLSSILHIQQNEPILAQEEDYLSIVIIQKNQSLIALLVEEIIGEREIVIKPLHAPLTHIHGVIGGTLSSSGQIIIVLNADDLVEMVTHSQKNVRIKNKVNTIKSDIDAASHILVVDDSITTRVLEKNILEAKGYKVTLAINGKDAWDMLQKEKFSLLITDVDMPVMDGFTLTENVKKSNTLSDLPVIIVTSLGSNAEKKRGINAGADAYVVKNEFESSQLIKIVEQLL